MSREIVLPVTDPVASEAPTAAALRWRRIFRILTLVGLILVLLSLLYLMHHLGGEGVPLACGL